MNISGPEYLLAVEDMQQASRDIASFFADYDMWLTPTIGQPPVPLGTFAFSEGDPFELRRRMATFSPYTYIANATGNPAMSVPLYWTDDGLPVGVHFLAKGRSRCGAGYGSPSIGPEVASSSAALSRTDRVRACSLTMPDIRSP